jgi:hypothetical protein
MCAKVNKLNNIASKAVLGLIQTDIIQNCSYQYSGLKEKFKNTTSYRMLREVLSQTLNSSHLTSNLPFQTLQDFIELCDND